MNIRKYIEDNSLSIITLLIITLYIPLINNVLYIPYNNKISIIGFILIWGYIFYSFYAGNKSQRILIGTVIFTLLAIVVPLIYIIKEIMPISWGILLIVSIILTLTWLISSFYIWRKLSAKITGEEFQKPELKSQ